jgi:hypothetical protein
MWQSPSLKYFASTDEIATAQLFHSILKHLFMCLAMMRGMGHGIANRDKKSCH